jgi:two-component sensor histidine kinase
MNFIARLINIGAVPGNDVFQNRLVKAVNIININAIVCLLVTALYGQFILKNETSIYILLACPIYCMSLVLNRRKQTMLAFSVMFFTSSTLMAIYCIRTAEESYTHIHFTLMITGISLLYRRKENRIHFFINAIYLLLCIVLVFVSFQTGFLNFLVDPQVDPIHQRHLNFVFLIICSIIFSSVIAITHQTQQKALEHSLQEQKVLLAEINHRVKNNLAVIVSLLNMQINNSKNKETKNAIQVVHNRIMSMALVHQKMYQNKSAVAIELESYITELVSEIRNSMSLQQDIKVEMEVAPINIDISVAIPLGLILNEIITNAIKHAFDNTENPKIDIELKKVNDQMIELTVKDNGKGMEIEERDDDAGMGLSLIDALTDQIDGKCDFEYENGLGFHLSIPLIKD